MIPTYREVKHAAAQPGAEKKHVVAAAVLENVERLYGEGAADIMLNEIRAEEPGTQLELDAEPGKSAGEAELWANSFLPEALRPRFLAAQKARRNGHQ